MIRTPGKNLSRLVYEPPSLGRRNMRNCRRSISTSWSSVFCWRSTNSSVSSTSSISSSDSRSVSMILFTSSIAVRNAGSDFAVRLSCPEETGRSDCASAVAEVWETDSASVSLWEDSFGGSEYWERPPLPLPRPRPPRRPRPERRPGLGAEMAWVCSDSEPVFASLSGTILIARCLDSSHLQRDFYSTRLFPFSNVMLV